MAVRMLDLPVRRPHFTTIKIPGIHFVRLRRPQGHSVVGMINLLKKSSSITAIYEPTIQKLWEPRHPTTVQTSTASYRDGFLHFN
jgi:hypothetical protein